MEHPTKERILKLFGEYALIRDEREKDEARSYLNSWKKYLLRRLQRDTYDVKIIDEQFGEIPATMMSALAQYSSMYLKIIIEFEWRYCGEYDKCEGITIRESDLKRNLD
jgi:hypothetical protein